MAKPNDIDFENPETCPSCGAYVGDQSMCENCGAVLFNEDQLGEIEEDDDAGAGA